MERLRDPESGCPWDRDQTFETIAPHTIEEAYEVADAIRRGDMEELRDELGDLLFQVVFYTQMAKEQGHFDFQDVVAAITEKMLRRHPHVFGDEVIDSVEEQRRAWEEHKARERRGKDRQRVSQMDGVAEALPALIRAGKLQRRAADVGFDWPDISGVFHKIWEELEEVTAEIEEGGDAARLEEEIGDLLFACVNLARHAGVDAEAGLRKSSRKFQDRFQVIEQILGAQGRSLEEADLEEMDALWERVKLEQRKAHEGEH
jgi:MazG family protein